MDVLERGSILDTLRAAVSEAADGRGRLVLLAAEAGGGKTTVVHQLGESIKNAARVVVGNCDALSTPRPLGPLLDMAPALGRDIATLLAEAPSRDRLFSAFLSELSRPSGPTLAVFEDVHWADEATLDLLRFLGRRIASTRAVLLATYREDEGPLRIALGDLATSKAVQRLTLAPLSETAVSILALGSGLDPQTLHWRTGGNPFFVTELVGAARSGSPVALPQSVRDVVQSRVARLSAAARAALEACAVVGAHVEIGFLAELFESDAGAVDECLAIGLLRADGLMLAFRNELGRDAVLEAIPPARRLSLHRQVLALLRQRRTEPDDLAQLAHHAEACGDIGAVLEFAPAAGRRAARLSAHREAVGQFQRALRFADHLGLEERALLWEALAHEYWVTDQVPRAIDTRLLALEAWRTLGNRLREGDCLRQLSRHYWYASRGSEHKQAIKQALEVLEPLPAGPELAWAYNCDAMRLFAEGDLTAAIAVQERALVLAQECGSMDALAYARNSYGCMLAAAGDGERGVQELLASIALSREADIEEHVVRGYANLTDVLSDLPERDLVTIGAYLRDGIAFADSRDLKNTGACMRSHLSEWSMLTGDWSTASDVAVGVAQGAHSASDAHRLTPLTVIGRLRARRGDPDVWPVLDEALALTTRIAEDEWIARARAARAEAAWLEGHVDQTREEAQAGLDLLEHSSAAWLISELAYWRWKTGDRTRLPPILVEPYALQIAGQAEQAAAVWRTLGYPYEAARALAETDSEDALREAHAEMLRLGATRSAGLVTQRMREIGARGLPRGPRPTTRANPAQLTDRELDVLALLAADLRNAEIAERLVLSRRTVDHHVSAILAKLGARSRAEAGRYARQLGVAAPQDRQPTAAI